MEEKKYLELIEKSNEIYKKTLEQENYIMVDSILYPFVIAYLDLNKGDKQ